MIMEKYWYHECPICGERHQGFYTRKEKKKIEKDTEKIISKFKELNPGAKRISVDGSLWFQWIDRNGNKIDGPRGAV